MTTSNAPTPVTIRSATPADREFVVQLAARLADFDRPPWRTREEIAGGDVPALNRAIDAPGPGTALFVADLEGRPAGCLLMWTLEDYFTHETHAHVSVIAVAKESEGRGVGGRLMQHAESWARQRGHRRLTLSVFGSNHRAQALYAREGYRTELLTLVKILD